VTGFAAMAFPAASAIMVASIDDFPFAIGPIDEFRAHIHPVEMLIQLLECSLVVCDQARPPQGAKLRARLFHIRQIIQNFARGHDASNCSLQLSHSLSRSPTRMMRWRYFWRWLSYRVRTGSTPTIRSVNEQDIRLQAFSHSRFPACSKMAGDVFPDKASRLSKRRRSAGELRCHGSPTRYSRLIAAGSPARAR